MSLAPEIKIAEQRLSVLELAKALGNVSAACKQRGSRAERRIALIEGNHPRQGNSGHRTTISADRSN